jgi:large subunit ribosomal protein L28
MSKVCQVTGKRPSTGFTYVTRGIAKKKKGIGLKVTGKTRRRFLPNLQVKRLWVPEEKRFVTLKLSCSAMRLIEKQGIFSVVRDLRKQGQKI